MPCEFPSVQIPDFKIGRRFPFACFVLWALFGLGQSADAQTALTWSGTGVSSNWSSTANWRGIAPTASGTNALLFNNNIRTTSTNNVSSLTLTSLSFGTSAGGFTISGSDVTLRGVISNSSANNQAISFGIALGTTGTFNAASAGTLTLAANSFLGGVIADRVAEGAGAHRRPTDDSNPLFS